MSRPRLWNKPRDIIKYLIGNIIFSAVLVFVFLPKTVIDFKTFHIGFIWMFSITITQSIGIPLIYFFIDKRISWIDAPVKRVFTQFTAFLLYSIIAFIIVQLFNFYVWRGKLPSQSWRWVLNELPVSIMISIIISLIYNAIGFFIAWKTSLLREDELKIEMMTYKYESLRNQINPHFLFNSLNVLTELVYDDQAMAVKFIKQLSELFRYVLDSRDKELVPLKEELEFVRSFAFLLKTRFENKLIIESDIAVESDDYIVPMTLQLLIENAVKHNEISASFPLHISIRKKGDYLEVENSLHPKPINEGTTKTGLKNIVQQFAFFSEKAIEVSRTDNMFLVRVPILKWIEK